MSQNTFENNPVLLRGGSYITLVVGAVQFVAIPGALLGALLVRLNAAFTPTQLGTLLWIVPTFMVIGAVILLVLSRSITGTARRRLDAIQNRDSRVKPEDELAAWREITGFSWRYGIAAILVVLFVEVLPGAIYSYSTGVISREQYLYTLIGGAASALLVALVSALLLERLLVPAQQLLTPTNPEALTAGRSGLSVAGRFQAVMVLLVTVGILIVAPIGYHHIAHMMDESGVLLREYQFQVLAFSLVMIGLGYALAYFSTRPVSDYLKEIATTFQKVEAGDLTQRVRVVATDETAELAVHFNQLTERLQSLQTQIDEEVNVRGEQLEAIFEVGQAALLIQNLDQLIEKVVSQIGDRFGYYFAALYLVDQTERWAELKGGTGAAGQVLLANKHRLDLSERNLVALTVASKQMQSSQLATDAPGHNPLLPYTRSEIALPLVSGDRIFGVLDVHSTSEAAFAQQEVRTLQNIANQVAAALQNARLYDEAQQSLQEMKASQKTYLKTSWDALISQRPTLGYTVGDDDAEDDSSVTMPLTLRDQKIGEISLTGGGEWTAEERSIVEAVAAQAALALENARLVEESQSLAARDHLLADITSKVWAATTIDGILQTAIRELGRALESDEAAIQLKMD
ncbi:MAG TPA: GAF domain-containing protein [Anaerolineales bacterium]|jgi:GAF domain-containing protein